MTGGQDVDFTNMRTTEIYNKTTRQFASYVDLPKRAAHHNLVAVNETHVVILAGSLPTDEVFIFDR